MKKVLKIIAVFIIFCANTLVPSLIVYADDFSDDTQVQEQPVQDDAEEELMFAPIELDLSNNDNNNKPVRNKRFFLKAEKDDKPQPAVKNDGTLWDDSKIFRYQTSLTDNKNIRPMASGYSLKTKLNDKATVTIGQDGLDGYNGYTINFFAQNGSMYNDGAKINGGTDKFDYTVGAYTQTVSDEKSYGGAISTKPRVYGKSKGTLSFGTGVYSSLLNNDTKNTTGFFTQYQRGRFSLGGQVSQSAYASGAGMTNNIHVLPQYQINEHLTLKSKIVKNMTNEETQEEIGIKFRPFKSDDSMEFELTGGAYFNGAQEMTRQRFKFSTNIKI